jgi:di/tricarboxylate transporter
VAEKKGLRLGRIVTWQMIHVLLVLALTMLLFASDRFRLDLVALLALLALLVPGVLTVPEGLAGFSDPAVLMIAGLFVVGGAIFQTGLADMIGRRLEGAAGRGYVGLMLVIMLVAAGLSAFLSSTGTVAVMLPIVVTLARRSRISPSLLLLPLAYATLLGGLLTLIATPPNIIISNQLVRAGYEPFGFFEFTPVGLILLAAGILFLLLLGPRLLPERIRHVEGVAVPSVAELGRRFGLDQLLFELEVTPGSKLAGRAISDAAIRSSHGVTVIAITSVTARGARTRRAEPDRLLQAGDLLTVQGSREAVAGLASGCGLELRHGDARLPAGLLLAELLVPPGSLLAGGTVAAARLRSRTGLTVLALRRAGELLDGGVAQQGILAGDLLLVLGSARSLGRLRSERDELLLVTEPEELRETRFNTRKAPWAVAIMLGMLLLMTLGLVPNVTAVLLAAAAMVVSGCLDMEGAYRHVNWQSIVLIACVLPLATALDKTGLVDLAVNGLSGALAGSGPYLVLAAMFLLTALVGLVISNTATAVLVAPIAIQVAVSTGINPRALLLVVAVAASAAFVTPVSSPVNLLVLSPGGYRFGDFVRAGLPLLLLVMLVTLLVVPLFFPLLPASGPPG